MMNLGAVIFDFIGTLAKVENYSLEDSEEKLFESLVADGFIVDHGRFMDAYDKAYRKYRDVRYRQLVEVDNAVWVSDALNLLDFATTPEDKCVKKAVSVFFEGYLSALKLRRFARSTLRKLSRLCYIGLVSNFTHAPVVYAGLRELKINDYFSIVLVSQAIGWRKPNPEIFKEILRRLDVKADEVFFVGDTPREDIQGAKNVGMKTVFIPSQFNTLTDMQKADTPPDHYIEDLGDLFKILDI